MKRLPLAMMTGLCVVLAACGSKGSAPTGQVVATVDGTEITATELRAELNGAAGRTPEIQKQLEQQALRAIVNRKLLVAQAKADGLDKTPQYAVQRQRAEDLALIGAFQQKLVGSLPKVSNDEIARYVADHPDSFAQRKVFSVDQLAVPQIAPAVVRQMEPLHSLAAIAAMLDANKVQYFRSRGSIDGFAADPDAVKRVAQQAAGEPFVVPTGPGVTVNVVTDARVDPVPDAQAIAAATRILMQRRSGDLVNRKFEEIIKAGDAKVSYNDAYKPAAAAKGAPKAAPGTN